MDYEQYAALTADDIEWLKSMGWKPQIDYGRTDGLIAFPFFPTISSITAPTTAEIRAGIRD